MIDQAPNGALAILPAALRAAGTEVRLRKGAMLFRQGGRPRSMYCVLAGEVRLIRTASHGAEIVLQRATSGFLAEASLDHGAYHCDAVAVSDATLLGFPRDEFQRALSSETFRMAWIGYVSAQLRRSRLQCERLLLRSARERVLHFLQTENRDGVLDLAMTNLTKKAWAAELGLTHEALYRTLRTMMDAGEIVEHPAGILRMTKARPRAAPRSHSDGS
jgi:CRP-like cAMP-binding protein